MPKLQPKFATVLNTAPASACVFSGKLLLTMIKPTVNKTSALKGANICAQNCMYQYDQAGFTSAIMDGASEQRNEDPTTSQLAGSLSTKIPTERFIATPMSKFGRR